MNFISNLRELYVKKNVPKIVKISKSISQYINTEFDTINEIEGSPKKILSNKNKNIRKSKSILRNLFISNSGLFTERETDVLKKMLHSLLIQKKHRHIGVGIILKAQKV